MNVSCGWCKHNWDSVAGGFGCPNNSFACKNGKCIPDKMTCDSNDNCGDGSDEEEGCKGNF